MSQVTTLTVSGTPGRYYEFAPIISIVSNIALIAFSLIQETVKFELKQETVVFELKDETTKYKLKVETMEVELKDETTKFKLS